MVAVKDNYIEQATGDTKSVEAKCIAFIDHAESSPKYANQRQRAAICEEFEQGKQWTAQQYARWKEVGIEPITINRCLTTIKAITGMYLENLQDITVIPRKGGSETGAQVITEVIKHSQDNGGYEHASFQAFQQGNIQTAAYLFVDVDKTKTVNGKVVFTADGFFDVIVDPDCETYDIDDRDKGAKYVIRKIYMDKKALELLYSEYGASSTEGRTTMENYIAEATTRSQFYTEEEKTYRSCVYQCFWKEIIPAVLIKDTQTGETKVVTKDAEKMRKKANKSRRFETEKTFTFILHRSVLINGKLMEDVENPYGEGIDFYPCVKYVPLWRPTYERGILDDITSLNYEENLRRTQVARLLNLTTNSGWKVAKVVDENARRELQQFGSVPGYIADESKFGGKVEKIEPNQLSQGHMLLAQQSSDDIKEVSNVNAAVQGYDQGTKNEPGVVLTLRKQQGEAANSSVFRNFRATLEMLGNKLLAILDKMDIYTDTEIRQIVQESHLIDSKMIEKANKLFYNQVGTTLQPPAIPPVPGPEMWDMVQPEDMEMVFDEVKNGIEGAKIYASKFPAMKDTFDGAIKELAIRMLLESLRDGDINQYGIKVVLSPSTYTARMRIFEIMMGIEDKYGVIPPDIMLEYTDLPNKDEIIARIRSSMQAQQQQTQQQTQPQAQPAA